MTDNIISVGETTGELRFNHRGFGHLGYNPPSGLTFEAWSNDAAFVRAIDRANKWIAGDYFAAGERFGEDAFQVLGDEHAWGMGVEKMRKLTWVARNVRPQQRRKDLSWSHHMLVAPLTPDEQDDWLLLAATKEMTVEQLKTTMIEAGAIVLRQKTVPVQEVVPVPYLDHDPKVEPETTDESAAGTLTPPDYPTIPLEMSDFSSNGSNGAGYNNGASSSNNGFERAPQWDADTYDYEDDDEVKFKIGKGAAKAARIIMNLAGAEFCASLVQELVLLATDEVYAAGA